MSAAETNGDAAPMSIAEMRKSDRVGLPERTFPVCLSPRLVSEAQTLWAQLEDAQEAAAAQTDGDATTGPPRRAAQKPPTEEIRQKLAGLRGELAAHTGLLVLRGILPSEWNTWVDEHPAREGNGRDKKYAYGFCNADDLLADLGRFAYTWNGDMISPSDWEFISENSSRPDQLVMCQIVVAMHEQAVDLPKLFSGWLATLGGATG